MEMARFLALQETVVVDVRYQKDLSASAVASVVAASAIVVVFCRADQR